MQTLTKKQLNRQDEADNAIFDLITKINPTKRGIDWNIEMIGDIREQFRLWIVGRLKLIDEMGFYPYLKIKK